MKPKPRKARPKPWLEAKVKPAHHYDCITIAPTGAGKTLTFWIPLLFNDNGIKVIITTLNLLGDENVKELARLKITAVNLTAATTTNTVLKVHGQ